MIYEILNGSTVINTIVASPDFMEAQYPEGNYRKAERQTPEYPQERFIPVGNFYDSFGDQKWPILASTDPKVQALIKDTSVRQSVDLNSPQLRVGLEMVVAAGFPINIDEILGTPAVK